MPSTTLLRRFVALLLLAISPALAQDATTGAIIGRVLNVSTGEYLRNAQVRIQETGQTTISEDGGEFRFAPVPPGKATLVVTYTGFPSMTTTVNVSAGATATVQAGVVINATGFITWNLDGNLYGGRATSAGGIAPYNASNEVQLDVNIKF